MKSYDKSWVGNLLVDKGFYLFSNYEDLRWRPITMDKVNRTDVGFLEANFGKIIGDVN